MTRLRSRHRTGIRYSARAVPSPSATAALGVDSERSRPTHQADAAITCRLLDLGLLGPLLDHVDGVLAVALVLVALAGGGDDLAVGRLEPPAMLLALSS